MNLVQIELDPVVGEGPGGDKLVKTACFIIDMDNIGICDFTRHNGTVIEARVEIGNKIIEFIGTGARSFYEKFEKYVLPKIKPEDIDSPIEVGDQKILVPLDKFNQNGGRIVRV